jgi:hypothetical protein
MRIQLPTFLNFKADLTEKSVTYSPKEKSTHLLSLSISLSLSLWR